MEEPEPTAHAHLGEGRASGSADPVLLQTLLELVGRPAKGVIQKGAKPDDAGQYGFVFLGRGRCACDIGCNAWVARA